ACFEAAIDAGAAETDPASLRDAVALYQDDFLTGFGVREAPEFDEWALTQRERLRELALRAFHRLAVHHTSAGEWPAAIEATSRLLALDPWREEAHRRLMLLLARNGERSAALAQYGACRRILAD